MELNNSVLKVNPEIAQQWDYEKNEKGPDTYTYGSREAVWWKCPLFECHSYKEEIRRKTGISPARCPFCAHRQLCPCSNRCNSIASIYPEIAKYWDYERNIGTPSDYIARKSDVYWWRCIDKPCHRWQMPILTFKKGCVICANFRLCEDRCNSIAKTCPEIAKEWDYERNKGTPFDYIAGGPAKFWWRCSIKPCHRWQQNVANRYKLSNGCPICVNKAMCEDRCNSLDVVFPEIAKDFHPTKNEKLVTQYVFGNGDKVWWQCPNDINHVYLCRIRHRTYSKVGCPECTFYISKGAETIINTLNNITGINFVSEKKFEKCIFKRNLPFDFYIEDLEILIEFDGMQHFIMSQYFHQDVITRDLIKTDFARKDFYFLRISYNEMPIIKEIVNKFIIDVSNKSISKGFYFNYLNKKLNANTLYSYLIHNETGKIEDRKIKLVNNIEK
jgi:hypothetical protein